jgi:hypothetical protein
MQSNMKTLTARGLMAVLTAALATLLLLSATTGVASATTASQYYVQQLYSRYTGRTPGASEVGYWAGQLDGGASRVGVVSAFFHSEEASAVQAASLIHTVLNRNADPGGTSFWGHQLAAGLPRAELLAQLYASGEFYANQGATDENFVFGIYQSFLGRNPTQADRNYWMQVAQSHGRLYVARVILGSGEGLNDLVSAAYQLGLHHPADPGGAAFWSKQVTSGAQSYDGVIVQIIASPKAYAQAQAGH